MPAGTVVIDGAPLPQGPVIFSQRRNHWKPTTPDWTILPSPSCLKPQRRWLHLFTRIT